MNNLRSLSSGIFSIITCWLLGQPTVRYLEVWFLLDQSNDALPVIDMAAVRVLHGKDHLFLTDGTDCVSLTLCHLQLIVSHDRTAGARLSRHNRQQLGPHGVRLNFYLTTFIVGRFVQLSHVQTTLYLNKIKTKVYKVTPLPGFPDCPKKI